MADDDGGNGQDEGAEFVLRVTFPISLIAAIWAIAVCVILATFWLLSHG